MRLHPLSVLLLVACTFKNETPAGLGESCVADDCARGLVCAGDGVCRVDGDLGTLMDGDACLTSAECAFGLACASDLTCTPAGDPGTAAPGEACAAPTDCRAGLDCRGDVCVGFEVPLWFGAECPDPDLETGPFRVFFEVPDDDPLSDFYRLPFPNDIRVDDSGLLDLSGHPSPGPLIERVGDVVGDVLRSAEVDTGGFGPNQAVFFRFSASPDFDTLDVGLPGDGTVALVDVTPGFEGRGPHGSVRYRLSTGRTPYLCHNWLAVHVGNGAPLTPGHTYAVILSDDIALADGTRLTPDADFAPLMSDTPATGRLSRPWAVYAPLRAWLADVGIDPARIAAAAVYTVADTEAEPAELFDAVAGLDAPTLTGAVLCGAGADPYADPADPTRGCATDGTAAFHEVQGLVALPQFQEGTPPFKDAPDGGNIDFTFGPVAPVRTEDVHVTLTVPRGAPPAEGWPVVLYGHGTGGNYTSAVRGGIADLVTAIDLDGTTVAFATLAFDAPLHGPRAAPENWDPAWLAVDPDAYDSDLLFFNPLNVRATRDNPLQEAADLWSLVALLQTLDLSAQDSPTGEALRFDPTQVHYVGHSQGGVVGALFLAQEPDVRSAVLSGAGGLTLEAFLGKTSPYDVPAALRVGLADPDIGREHPILNLAQQVAERADGVNHARRVLLRPPDGFARKHVLQIFGVGDTYSPDATQFSLARALGLDQVPGTNPPLDLLDTVTLPVSGNGPGGTTAVVALYAAAGGEDAHFVLFERADAQRALTSFLATQVRDGVPTVAPL